jgi:hypothetical protein
MATSGERYNYTAPRGCAQLDFFRFGADRFLTVFFGCGGVASIRLTAFSKAGESLGEGLGMAKPDYPKTQEERVRVYLRIMEEIKSRLHLIDVVKKSDLPFPHAREICTLQLRHICELIAIGCLAAQGRLTGSSLIINEDNPKKILRELDKTWQHAFPQCATLIREDGGTKINANSKPNALTRRETENMWANSGTFLHRLTIKKFFTPEEDKRDPWGYISTQVSKILDLLTDHVIAIPNPERMLLVSLSSPNGKAQASFFEFDLANKKANIRTTLIQ